MRLGMNLFLWTTHVTLEHVPLFSQLRAQGYGAVEIPTIEGNAAHYRELGRAVADAGLACTTVTFLGADQDPLSADKGVVQKGVDHMRWSCEMANELGAELICGPLHSALGVFSGAGPTREERDRSLVFLRKAAEIASAAGVVVALEYLNRFESYLVNTAADTASLVRAVDHPSIRCAYDTHHAHIEESDVSDAIRDCADVLAHVQLSESHRGAPGTGQVAWRESLAALRDISYEGWLMVESFSRADPEFAAAVNIWRDHAPDEEAVWKGGFDFLSGVMESLQD